MSSHEETFNVKYYTEGKLIETRIRPLYQPQNFEKQINKNTKLSLFFK